MKKKPYIFMVLKLVGVIGVIIFVIGAIKIFTGFGDFENNNFMIGSFMLPIGLFLSVFYHLLMGSCVREVDNEV